MWVKVSYYNMKQGRKCFFWICGRGNSRYVTALEIMAGYNFSMLWTKYTKQNREAGGQNKTSHQSMITGGSYREEKSSEKPETLLSNFVSFSNLHFPPRCLTSRKFTSVYNHRTMMIACEHVAITNPNSEFPLTWKGDSMHGIILKIEHRGHNHN